MGTDMDFPRTAIVNAHFSEHYGVGTFLGRLFSGWPRNRLACVSGTISPPDWQRCERFYRTGDREFRLPGPLNQMATASRSGPLFPSAQSDRAATVTGVSLRRRLARYPWRALLRMLGGGEILYRVGPSPQLLAWVREFQPEVLYGHCSDLNSVRFLTRMWQKLHVPLLLHCMDDWPENLYRDGLSARLLGSRFRAECAALFRSADVVVAISQEMAEEYQRRYRRPVPWLAMPAELDAHRAAARVQWTAGRPFRLRYGGRVGWAIRESLADLARAIDGLRQEGEDVTFEIVTANLDEVPAICRTSLGVSVRALGPLAELPRAQAAADVLVICYDFDEVSFRQSRYSMPSKLAECMATGTPILVYGPAGLPVVEYARREGWGMMVDRRDPAALRDAVAELMRSAALREQFGRTAQKQAAERHDARLVSKSLHAIVLHLASQRPCE